MLRQVRKCYNWADHEHSLNAATATKGFRLGTASTLKKNPCRCNWPVTHTRPKMALERKWMLLECRNTNRGTSTRRSGRLVVMHGVQANKVWYTGTYRVMHHRVATSSGVVRPNSDRTPPRGGRIHPNSAQKRHFDTPERAAGCAARGACQQSSVHRDVPSHAPSCGHKQRCCAPQLGPHAAAGGWNAPQLRSKTAQIGRAHV